MNDEWMEDARKIPDEVMKYIRKIVVRSIKEKSFQQFPPRSAPGRAREVARPMKIGRQAMPLAGDGDCKRIGYSVPLKNPLQAHSVTACG